MKRYHRFGLVLGVVATSLTLFFFGCGGSDDSLKIDGGDDATIDNGLNGGDGDTDGTAPCPWCNNEAGTCVGFGSACKSNSECCANNCLNGVCGFPNCTSDNQACNSNGDCCSQICTNKVCQPLNNSCKTLGNKCGQCDDCCSKYCKNGLCEPSSYCTQGGDVCATNGECCTGICNKPMNQVLGTCSTTPPGGASNCGQVDGVLCGKSTMCTDATV